MKSINYLVIIVLFAITLSSSKNYQSPELLLSGGSSKSWKLSSESLNGQDITPIRYTSCKLDNIYTFTINNLFWEIEGPTKCVDNAPDTLRRGHWKLNPLKNTITLESNIDTLSFLIEYVDEQKAIGVLSDSSYGILKNIFVAY